MEYCCSARKSKTSKKKLAMGKEMLYNRFCCTIMGVCTFRKVAGKPSRVVFGNGSPQKTDELPCGAFEAMRNDRRALEKERKKTERHTRQSVQVKTGR